MSHINTHQVILLLILSVLCVLLTGTPVVAQNQCDPALRPVETNPNGYQQRGDRCEGVYIDPKSGAGVSLVVASFTRSFKDFDSKSRKPLLISWALPGNPSIHLRAFSLREKLYYRMDSNRPAGETGYTWFTDVLASIGMQKSDVGVVGLATLSMGGQTRQVYVPLNIEQQGYPASVTGYEVLLIPTDELKRVVYTLARLSSDGKLQNLRQNANLGSSFYPAFARLRIPISGLGIPGIYYLEMSGTPIRGNGTTTRLYFYHSGS